MFDKVSLLNYVLCLQGIMSSGILIFFLLYLELMIKKERLSVKSLDLLAISCVAIQ